MFQKGISEYAEMDSLQKLKLLNFVCDEALSTSYVIEIYSYHTYIHIYKGFSCCDKFFRVMRNFIENHENPDYVENKKKAEEKLNAAEAKVTIKNLLRFIPFKFKNA